MADLNLSGNSRPLPHEEIADGIAAEDAVEKFRYVITVPPVRALE
jgi:hypothetical protein